MSKAKAMLLKLYKDNHTDLEVYMVNGKVYATKASIARMMNTSERVVAKWMSEGLSSIGDNTAKLIPVDEVMLSYGNSGAGDGKIEVSDTRLSTDDSLERFLTEKMTPKNIKNILDIEKVQKLRHDRQKAGAEAQIKMLNKEKEELELQVYKKSLIRKEEVNKYIENSQIRFSSAIMKAIENIKIRTKKRIKSMVSEESQNKIDKHLDFFLDALTKEIKRNLNNE